MHKCAISQLDDLQRSELRVELCKVVDTAATAFLHGCRFHEQVEPLAARLPYMTSLGNHERDWPGSGYMEGDDSGGECGVATERRFLMPTPAQDAYWCAPAPVSRRLPWYRATYY